MHIQQDLRHLETATLAAGKSSCMRLIGREAQLDQFVVFLIARFT